jgi:hypothetical protein
MSTVDDKVDIVSPDSSIFDVPVFNIGETVVINGIATNDLLLYIEGVPYEVTVQNYKWSYEWNTSTLAPGDHLIKVECDDAQDEILIKLIDVNPPFIKIDAPLNGENS